MTKILAVNAGSSSLKFQLLTMPEETVITSGVIERIGFEDAIFNIKVNGEKRTEEVPIPNHSIAVQMLLEALVDLKIVKSLKEINGIGHRIVQGGDIFSGSVLVTNEVLKAIEDLADLAPLHNLAHAIGIKAFNEVLPDVPSVVVFDTAFHQTMPKESYMYPTPYEWYEKHSVRKYGFHGTSHKYVAQRTAELLKEPIEKTKIITIHIGAGGSLAAVDGGKSVNTSMGFTPLAGIMMGTRSGNIDPSIIQYIMEKENISINEITQILNKKSGLYGISGISSDMRDIKAGIDNGNERAQLAYNLFIRRIVDHIASYYVELGGCDAIVFTAGIGENCDYVRRDVINSLSVLNVELDPEANKVFSEERLISSEKSKIKVFVIPTNEEVMIARDTMRLISK